MTDVVLDASVAVAWIAPTQANVLTDELLSQASDHRFWAPFLFPVEVRNGLLKLENRGVLPPSKADEGLEQLVEAQITVVDRGNGLTLDEVFLLARSRRASMFDAFYIALAYSLECPLASRDKRQLEAAAGLGLQTLDLRRPI